MEAGGSSSEEFRFKCDVCQKRFRQRYNLRIHLRKHTGETPFKCLQEGCSARFKWRSGLVNHMRHHDPTQKVLKRNRRVEKPPSPPKAVQPTIANMLNEASSGSQSSSEAKKNDILADFELDDFPGDTFDPEFWDEPLTPFTPDILMPAGSIEDATYSSSSSISGELVASLQRTKEGLNADGPFLDKWMVEPADEDIFDSVQFCPF
mmetsp:Transcript_329/g.1106  ORF Transcript_329/g.1106 Transcript_329/m.1106 type:complete len:206 (-) Transcript_329:203-820(-)